MGMLDKMRKPGGRVIGWKVLVYGGFGTGKTKLGLTMPKSIVIDSEDGWSHYEDEAVNTVGIIPTSSSKELKELYKDLEDDEDVLKGMNTLIIDSKSNIYSSQQVSAMEVEERRAKTKRLDVDDQTVAMRGWGKIKLDTKRLQALQIDLASKGKFVVEMAQEADITKELKGGKRIIVGHKPDIHKTEQYTYDTIIRLYKEDDGDGGISYFAKIDKDRTEVFKEGDIIEGGVSFENWKPYFDKKNGGKSVKVAKTSYADDIQTDEKELENENNLIEDTIKLARQFMKDNGKASMVKIFKVVKINKFADIDSSEKATIIKELIADFND